MAIFNHTNFVDGFSVIARCNSADVATRIDNRTEFIQRKFFSDFFGAEFYDEIAVNLASEEPEWETFRSKVKPALLAFFTSDWLKFSETIATETGGSSTGSPASTKQSNTKKAVEQYNAAIVFANDFVKWLGTSGMEITNIPTKVNKTKLLPLFNF